MLPSPGSALSRAAPGFCPRPQWTVEAEGLAGSCTGRWSGSWYGEASGRGGGGSPSYRPASGWGAPAATLYSSHRRPLPSAQATRTPASLTPSPSHLPSPGPPHSLPPTPLSVRVSQGCRFAGNREGGQRQGRDPVVDCRAVMSAAGQGSWGCWVGLRQDAGSPRLGVRPGQQCWAWKSPGRPCSCPHTAPRDHGPSYRFVSCCCSNKSP